MREDISLQGRAALITGSVGGLGAEVARTLAGAGVQVMLTGLDAADVIEPLCREIAGATGAQVGYTRADLASLDEIAGLVARTRESLGRIDILVNSAVVRHFAPIEAFPADRWSEALAVNLSAPFHLTRMVLPAMRAAGYGRIFNFTSVYGSRGTQNRVDYVATKSGIEGLTRATAMECTDGAVTCHALCPGSVLTPSLKVRIKALAEQEHLGWDEAVATFLKGKQPSGCFVEERSVAEVLLMLCGRVGPDMNGAIVPIEGGWLARA